MKKIIKIRCKETGNIMTWIITDVLKDRKEHGFLKWLFKVEEVQNA